MPFYQPMKNDHLEVCSDVAIGKKAFALYKKLKKNISSIQDCPYPCSYLETKVIGSKVNPNSYVSSYGFTINKFTKTKIAHYTYTELELIAEFGGYVGLFLGYSVLNFSHFFGKCWEYFVRQ